MNAGVNIGPAPIRSPFHDHDGPDKAAPWRNQPLSSDWQRYFVNLRQPSTSVIIVIEGAGTGGNDTTVFQNAIDLAYRLHGGTILIPPGTYLLDTVTFPAGDTPIALVGQGES